MSGRKGRLMWRLTRVETAATGTLKWTVKVRTTVAPGNSPHPRRWKKAQPRTFRKGPRGPRQSGADHGPLNLGPPLVRVRRSLLRVVQPGNADNQKGSGTTLQQTFTLGPLPFRLSTFLLQLGIFKMVNLTLASVGRHHRTLVSKVQPSTPAFHDYRKV